MNFIKALIHDPDVLFLDEPTSGLDPTNSRMMKDIILAEKGRGKTIIITTHNMFDATELCDQVAFIVAGKVSALDTPHNLIMSRGAAKLQYTYFDGVEKIGECALDKTSEDQKLQSLFAIIGGTALTSAIFTMLGIIAATKIASLNQFLLIILPIEMICFVPPIANLFVELPKGFLFFPFMPA